MKKIFSAFFLLNRFEKCLWIISMLFVAASFIFADAQSPMTLCASLIGVTALIFVAKGEPLGQLLTVVFSVFYGIISFRTRYYGEMITYLGMTSPIAAASFVSWLRHPYESGKTQVKAERLTYKKTICIFLLSLAVTVIFWFILKYFNTASLLFSTISVFTSFAACSLLLLRSPFYALAYASNDIVLIILWIIASMKDSSALPMIICFLMFFANDMYGFFNWRKMQKKQSS